MATIDLGSIGLVFRGEWEAVICYSPNDVVTYKNACWVCQGQTTNEPGDLRGEWQKMVSGVTGPAGPQGIQGPKGEAGEPKELSDLVNSTSSTVAASSKAVKTAYDKAVSAAGNSATANALANARTIGISGAVTGTATSFTGAANITIPITALDVSKATAGTLPVARGGTGQTTVAATRNALGLGNTTGALPVANGGTGATSVAAARNALGLGNTTGALPVANGGTGATSAAAARNALGLGNTAGALPVANGGTGATSAAAARNALGLGNTAGALPVANGGTGATSAAAARKNLGISDSGAYEICEFYFFRHATLRAGFQLAQGGLLANAKTLYPTAWDYLVNGAGKALCKTEAQWQTLSKATFATVNGTAITWNGIGGVPWFAPNTSTGALRLPDIRGMYMEASGFDSLAVGGVHGDLQRNITGGFSCTSEGQAAGGVMEYTKTTSFGRNMMDGTGGDNKCAVLFDASRAVPTGNKLAPRAWGALACVYLGS